MRLLKLAMPLNTSLLSWPSILLFLLIFLLNLIWPSFSAETKAAQEFRKGNTFFKAQTIENTFLRPDVIWKNYFLQFHETSELGDYF